MNYVSPFADLTSELAQYALEKPGTHLPYGRSFESCRFCPVVDLTGTPLVHVLEVIRDGDRYFARFPIRAGKQGELLERFTAVQPSKWGERHGCFYVDVTLGGDVGVKVLKKLIDHAYKISCEKQPPIFRTVTELAESELTYAEVLERLIEKHELSHVRSEIQGLARRALLMVTRPDDGMVLPFGCSRLGGQPDLPPGTAWPTFDGRPLAFLAQLDLAELSSFPQFASGLPADGLLSFFSVFGWREDEGYYDPDLPDDNENTQAGWSRFLLHKIDDVVPTPPPGEVENLKPTTIEFREVIDLPRHELEPEVQQLSWSEDQWEAFDELADAFRYVIMMRNYGALSTYHGPHQLGGYADSEYGPPSQIKGQGFQLLMQIGCDSHADMTWGDAGHLNVYTKRSISIENALDDVICDYQSG